MSLKGILGLGAFSTQYYLGEIQRKFKVRNKEFSTCPYLLYQIDFQEINPFLPNQFAVLKPKIESVLNEILSLGISELLVPNITLHETLDKIESPLKLFHPVKLTIDYLVKNKISKITLFGTLYTMNSDYLKEKFSENNIELILPSEEHQIWLDNFRKKVFDQIQTQIEIETYQNLIIEYSVQNPVVIACTELSVFALKNDSKCIDMADLQIEEFLK
ncbi:aspartate/glutamate racemase family protein [Halpernia frigidisoli]|uniref:Aspartate racemase n=1 Tax=Halpernia frigidisoli TaxID=1125876 RepID=A0A1I3GZM3_9FLAO|nr:aspartate/glutamate racemase family protein [Halpernia frigidisoli]SFI28944.1 aspartate racemase [Halpernia frigidisoli]